MQTLAAADEQKLIAGVKTAVDLVDNQGMSPDEALIKVARDSQLTPGFVRAAVSAFNNGRQLAQFRANDNILDKLAEFPLADYDAIHEAIWGGSEKSARDSYRYDGAIHEDYSRGPAWLADQQREKVAHAPLNYPPLPKLKPYQPDGTRKMIVAYSNHQRVKQAFEEQRGKYSAAHDNVTMRVSLLKNYFNKLAMDRLPFHQVDYAAQTYFGAHGKALMDHLASLFPKEKRAADMRVLYEKPLDLNAAPFSYVKLAIDAAVNVCRTKEAMDSAYQALEKSAEDLSPFALAPQSQSPLDPVSVSLIEDTAPVKVASWLGGAAIASGTKGMLDRALGPQARAQAVDDAWLSLEDPDHNNELRKIRAQTMLNGMLSDPENPISGYDPDIVLNAFNELSQLAPRVAEQPAALQPLLAKRLAGHSEPFEVKEITDMEKGLKDARTTTPSTSIMTNAPNSILG